VVICVTIRSLLKCSVLITTGGVQSGVCHSCQNIPKCIHRTPALGSEASITSDNYCSLLAIVGRYYYQQRSLVYSLWRWNGSWNIVLFLACRLLVSCMYTLERLQML